MIIHPQTINLFAACIQVSPTFSAALYGGNRLFSFSLVHSPTAINADDYHSPIVSKSYAMYGRRINQPQYASLLKLASCRVLTTPQTLPDRSILV
jgi:hypothetical protein